MIDQLTFLGKKEELEFSKRKFRGKNAGKIYRYSNHIDGLIRTRAIIIAMVLLVFIPVVLVYQENEEIGKMLLYERLIYSVFFLVSSLLFNRARYIAVLLTTLPLLALLSSYLLIPGNFSFRAVGFLSAILFTVLSGLYSDRKAKKIKNELSNLSLENTLID